MLILLLLLSVPEPLHVVTTTTDLADIARIVGGEQVDVQSLCRGPEDPHFLEARPSFLRLVNRADLVVVIGMELEEGYMPLLLRDASNPRVRPGASGFLDASGRIRKLQVGGPRSRAHGDVHASGNPHYLADPANAAVLGEEVAKVLASLRPAGAEGFAARARGLREEIDRLLAEMEPRFRPFRGAAVLGFHDDLAYLAERFGLVVAGTLEPKPGVPPTARHIAEQRKRAKAVRARAVLHSGFHPRAPVDAICEGTGMVAVLLAHQPGATSDAPDLLAMYRRNLEALLAALERP